MLQEWPKTFEETKKRRGEGKREQVSRKEREVSLREALKGVKRSPLGLLPDDLKFSDGGADAKYFDCKKIMRLLTEKMSLGSEYAQKVLAIKEGKIRQHIIRMLDPSRSLTERNFADWFLKEYGSIEKNFFSGNGELKEITGGEKRIETSAFWTLAPYLFQEIQKKARDQRSHIWPGDAMYLVFDWLKQSVEQNEGKDFRLIGLDDMLKEYQEIHPYSDLQLFLPRDKNHPFHKYIQQLAKKVVKNVIYPRYLELRR